MKIFEITLFGIHIAPTYYALMYILAFLFAGFFLKKYYNWKNIKDLDELIFFAGLGVIIGGRLGYTIMYNPSFYLTNPLEIFAIWKGGMSFHGGLIGVIVSTFLFCRKFHYHFWKTIDTIAVITPLGIGLGRFGNYLNNELYGFSPYNGPFAMKVKNNFHFPSPLLEMFLEGIILGILLLILFFKTDIKKIPGKLSGIFLVGYSVSRIFIEFFRLPDANIGYIFHSSFLTLGMFYSIPLLFGGIFLLIQKEKI